MKQWFLPFAIFTALLLANPIKSYSAVNPIQAITSSQSSDEDFLKREQAFQISADLDENQLYVRWKIADGYYLYKKRFNFSVEGATMGEPVYPVGEMKYDEFFEEELEVFHHFVEIHIPLTKMSSKIVLSAGSQGCAEDGLCYTPIVETLSFTPDPQFVDASVTPAQEKVATQDSATESTPVSSPKKATFKDLSNDQQAVANYLKDSNALIAIGLFLLLGLGLTFTPCVFPMMPIIASIIAGQDKPSTSKAFWLSFTYVQGVAVTYVLLGILTASVGHSLAGLFQSPAIIIGVALLFILLALSMFGFYELALPSSWQNKLTGLSNSQTGGTYLGVAIMGAISALIVSPCITAPLSGALLHIANTGDYVFGALAMYALAMGMGIPLIIIGVSEGKFMLKAGGWMNGVKAAFGVSLLAVAIIISDHLIPATLVLILWGLLFIGSGVYLGAFEAAPDANWKKFWKVVGIAFVVTGIIYFVGAAQGNKDLFKPLTSQQTTLGNSQNSTSLPFIQIPADYQSLKQAITKANAQGKTVMLDFYADWCVSCEEFARDIFPDPAVKKALVNSIWLQIDLSETNEKTNLLMDQLDILGLPSILFYNLDGVENPENRVTGYMSADEFVTRIDQAFKI